METHSAILRGSPGLYPGSHLRMRGALTTLFKKLYNPHPEAPARRASKDGRREMQTR